MTEDEAQALPVAVDLPTPPAFSASAGTSPTTRPLRRLADTSAATRTPHPYGAAASSNCSA